jgi:hypothetical protein
VSAGEGERRIPIGPLVGLAGALMLLLSLFLDWWDGATAFTAFEVLDLALAGLALAAIAALVQAVGVRLPAPAPDPALALPLAVAALAIVVSQLINDPPAIVASGRGPAAGLWIALGGGILMVAGGAISAARISLALDPEGRETSRRRRGAPEPEPAGEPAAARMRARAAARAAAAQASPEPAATVPEPERPGGE